MLVLHAYSIWIECIMYAVMVSVRTFSFRFFFSIFFSSVGEKGIVFLSFFWLLFSHNIFGYCLFRLLYFFSNGMMLVLILSILLRFVRSTHRCDFFYLFFFHWVALLDERYLLEAGKLDLPPILLSNGFLNDFLSNNVCVAF